MGRPIYEMLNLIKYDYVDYRSKIMDTNGNKVEVSWGRFDCSNINKFDAQTEIFNGKNDALSVAEEFTKFAEVFEEVDGKNIAILVIWQNEDEIEAPPIRFNEA